MMTGSSFAIKGNVIYAMTKDDLVLQEQCFLICEQGRVRGVFQALPADMWEIPVYDYGDCLILPGLCDLHTHAPQFSYRATGMDLELLDWLERYTFPEEANYHAPEYAQQAYDIFVKELLQGATTRACVFATIHTEATLYLMQKLEQLGFKGFVGKVNMDRNCPNPIREKDAETSLSDTREWLSRCMEERFENILPILTPRFTPSCSDLLMEGLGALAKERSIPVQSHLDENLGEIEWVKRLCPDCEDYAESYAKYGLFGQYSRTVMAHCVYCSDRELTKIKENGVFIAHCPQSNINVSSGIAPVRNYLQQNLRIGLGTDVAGGSSLSMFRAMSDAIAVSKLFWRLVDQSAKPLSAREVFYLATKGGGEFFGKVGSFEQGYEFDAIVIDDSSLRSPRIFGLEQRLERYIHLGSDCVQAKFIGGKKVL